MKKILLTIILILIIISCNNDKDIPNSVPFTFKGSLPIINVKINGVDAKLLVDTGAFSSIIDSSSSSKYNFNVYNIDDNEVSGIGGTLRLYGAKNIKTYYKDEPMYIRFKSSNLTGVKNSLGVVGIVGSDYFVNHNIIVDYKNRALRKPTLID